MACMEHQCTNHKCDYFEMNNETVKVCPKCGSKVISFFDEEGDHYPDPREEESENDDDSY